MLEALPTLHGCALICDCPRNVLYHADILRALVWTTTTSRTVLPRRRHRQGEEMALLAAGLRPARAVPVMFSQETVIAALMALCPHVHWTGFQWPMIEDLLVGDFPFLWLNTMQNRADWHGQAFGPALVGPVERSQQPTCPLSTGFLMIDLPEPRVTAASLKNTPDLSRTCPPLPCGVGTTCIVQEGSNFGSTGPGFRKPVDRSESCNCFFRCRLLQPKLANTCVHGNFVSVRSGELLPDSRITNLFLFGTMFSMEIRFSRFTVY